MGMQDQSNLVRAFGPFEVNAAAGELRKRGVHVRLSGQPFQILLVLLAHPGELVSRDKLRNQIWGEGTFVDFEGGLNAAIAKLRRALNDSAENPRYIETVPGLGYRFIGALAQRQAEPISPIHSSAVAEELPRKRRFTMWWLAAGSACVISFLLGWRIQNPPAPLTAWKLTRLTADPGLSANPAISHEGTLLAYSSDRSGEGQMDLYVKQIAGDQSIRLTFDGLGNTTPDFSPDGSEIVFRSNRGGGGIYEIPTFGGEARLLARDGLNPRFSPDGSKIAYWIGDPGVASAVPGSGAVWVVPVTGGQPRPIGSNFTSARYPVWSPDSEDIVFVGFTSQKAYDRSAIDWWLVSTNGDRAVKTGAYAALVAAGLQARDRGMDSSSLYAHLEIPTPACWSALSDALIFSVFSGDRGNLWKTNISRETGKVSGVFKRLTAGAGNESEASCAAENLMVFSSVNASTDVWAVPFDLNNGKPTGLLERITQTSARQEHASLSRDGRHLAFASARAGRMNIWVRELATGKESHVATSSFAQRFPVSDSSGSRVAFSVFEQNGKRSIYVSTPRGTPDKLCEACLRATDWSPDGKSLLIFSGDPYQVNSLEIASRKQTALVKHSHHHLLFAHFSPDSHWISFTERIQPNRARIVIAPIDGPKPVPESAWIQIAEGGLEDWANWSPDGTTLYFTSARDGHFCIWAQRIDPVSHRPVGAAFAAQHLHGRETYQQQGWSAAEGRIAMVLQEATGNIWLMSRSASTGK